MNRRDLLKSFAGVCAVSGIKEVNCDKIDAEDIIILKSPYHLSETEISNIQKCSKEVFGTRKVVILSGGMDIGVIRKNALCT